MQVLLVLNRQGAQNVRIIVKAHTKSLKEKVISLLEKEKEREAFDLLYKNAEVETYLDPGQKPDIKPLVTLFEDELR